MTQMNLFPWRVVRRERRARYFHISMGIVGGLALLFVMASCASLEQRIEKQKQVNSDLRRDKLSGINAIVRQVKDTREEARGMIKRIRFIEKLKETRYLPVTIFNELSAIMPEGAYLEKLQWEGSRIVLRGQATTPAYYAELVGNLEKSPRFVEVQPKGGSRSGGNRAFEIELFVRSGIELEALQEEVIGESRVRNNRER